MNVLLTMSSVKAASCASDNIGYYIAAQGQRQQGSWLYSHGCFRVLSKLTEFAGISSGDCGITGYPPISKSIWAMAYAEVESEAFNVSTVIFSGKASSHTLNGYLSGSDTLAGVHCRMWLDSFNLKGQMMSVRLPEQLGIQCKYVCQKSVPCMAVTS